MMEGIVYSRTGRQARLAQICSFGRSAPVEFSSAEMTSMTSMDEAVVEVPSVWAKPVNTQEGLPSHSQSSPGACPIYRTSSSGWPNNVAERKLGTNHQQDYTFNKAILHYHIYRRMRWTKE